MSLALWLNWPPYWYFVRLGDIKVCFESTSVCLIMVRNLSVIVHEPKAFSKKFRIDYIGIRSLSVVAVKNEFSRSQSMYMGSGLCVYRHYPNEK